MFCFQNTVYPSYRKEASSNAYPTHSPVLFFSFAGFEEESKEKENPELQEFHSWHAKGIGRNAWIFHDGLDTRHSKRSHFIVKLLSMRRDFRSLSEAEKGLPPFATGRTDLYVNRS